MAYVVPQVRVYQEFAQAPAAVANPLRAFVIGPNYQLVRESENEGRLGQYNPQIDVSYSWPGRTAGAVVDESFTSVVVRDALLRYYNNTVGNSADEIKAIAGRPNRLRAEAINFKTANGYSRAADFYSRDVQVGDIIRVYANVGGDLVEKWSRIVDLLPDESDSIVDSVATADVDNSIALVGGNPLTNNTGTGGGTRNIASNAIGSGLSSTYDGLADGYPQETYVIEITTASVSGAGALAKVTSASGTDDAVDVPITASAQTIGTRGTTFNWGGSGEWYVGDKFVLICRQTYNVPDVTGGGTFDSDSDTTYIITVTKGGVSGVAQISVSTTNGLDVSGPHTVTEGASITIGTKGTTVSFDEPIATLKLVKGESWYLDCTGRAETGYKTLVLADNLPTELQGIAQSSSSGGMVDPSPDLNISLYIKKNITLPANRIPSPPDVNWVHGATNITLKSGVTVYDSSFVDNDGDYVSLTLDADSDGQYSILYVTYRALLQTYASSIASLTDISEVEGLLGPVVPDNPLAMGVWYALRNSNGTEVLFMAVPTDDSAGYSVVLDKASVRSDIYTIVPMTKDGTIQNLVAGHVDAMSAADKGRWRITFLNGDSSATEALIDTGSIYPSGGTTAYEDADLLATVTDDLDATGTQYTLVTWDAGAYPAGGGFVDMGVRAGDIFRINYQGDGFGNQTYDSFVVDSVVSNQQLKLLSGPASAINVARKFSVQRSLTKAEEATAYGAKAGAFSNRRVYYVWPDVIEDGAGAQISGIYLCAAIAGLISAVVPQQGLTNVAVEGFSDVTRTVNYFSEGNLNTMAEAGVWIVTKEPTTGAIYTRHELSTDMTDLNSKELMVVKNVDSMRYIYLNQLKPYVGRANVTPKFLILLRRQLMATTDFLKANGSTPSLGGQLISAEILELRQHAVNPDQVVIKIGLTIPYPANILDVYLVV